MVLFERVEKGRVKTMKFKILDTVQTNEYYDELVGGYFIGTVIDIIPPERYKLEIGKGITTLIHESFIKEF